MTTKRFTVARSLGRWALVHNGEAIATFDTEAEAEHAAEAIARTQPLGDDAEVVIEDEAPPPAA